MDHEELIEVGRTELRAVLRKAGAVKVPSGLDDRAAWLMWLRADIWDVALERKAGIHWVSVWTKRGVAGRSEAEDLARELIYSEKEVGV